MGKQKGNSIMIESHVAYNHAPKNVVLHAGQMNHLTHPEDSVLYGSNCVIQTLTELQSINTISLKFDGKIGIIFGYDHTGQFQLVCKHQFDKIRQNKTTWSTIREYDVSRNSIRENLWTFEKNIKIALKKATPKVNNIFWFGDLLYTNTPPVINKYYTFKPNVVKYQIYACSKYGASIKNSIAGIAIHTCYDLNKNVTSTVTDISNFKNNKVMFFNHTVHVNQINIPKTQLKIINDNMLAVDDFIKEIKAIKAKSLLTAVSPFITKMISENDITNNIEHRFIEFLEHRLSQSANKKLLDNGNGWIHSVQGKQGLISFWTVWKALYTIKNHLKCCIDTKFKPYYIKGYINNVFHHEGYVVGQNIKFKLVDRLIFSKANNDRYTVSLEEKIEKANMPSVAFCYGRCNPPTLGHKLLFEKTINLGDEAYVFLSGTTGKKNPLSFNDKVSFIQKIYPHVSQHIVKEPFENPIKIMNYLYSKGHRHIIVVAGSDRLTNTPGSLRYLLETWNSGPMRINDTAFGEHGREYVYITYHCCGERNDTNIFSSTKARHAVVDNNAEQFWQLTGNYRHIKVNRKNIFDTLSKILRRQT